MESGKLRHEIVINEYGEVDEDLNNMTMTKCLIEIEETNHNNVKILVEKGYKLATLLKRDVQKTVEQCRKRRSSRQSLVHQNTRGNLPRQ